MTADKLADMPDITSMAVRALMLYSLGEFQLGHATTIRVTVDGDSFGIEDDGRGHPLDKTLEGTSYLTFIYNHFDYPFDEACNVPVQHQGIGMSLVNALCSELDLTVRKPDATLQLGFRNGVLQESHRAAVQSPVTGIRISAKLRPPLRVHDEGATRQLEAWLLGVLATSPSLKLFFNGRLLQLKQEQAARDEAPRVVAGSAWPGGQP